MIRLWFKYIVFPLGSIVLLIVLIWIGALQDKLVIASGVAIGGLVMVFIIDFKKFIRGISAKNKSVISKI